MVIVIVQLETASVMDVGQVQTVQFHILLFVKRMEVHAIVMALAFVVMLVTQELHVKWL